MAEKYVRLGFEPAHPGEIIREDILPALGMNISELAAHLGVSRVTLSRLVNERSAVSMDMARRLGAAFGNGPRIWLALQMQYDLWHAEQEPAVEVKRLKREEEAA
jgi:addiction module HigA family antidote